MTELENLSYFSVPTLFIVTFTFISRSILDESLSTSILEDEPLRFHYIENGSKRGGKLLVGSLGYTYGVKVILTYIC